MVQPYHPSVDTEGEISIVFVDGEASHALRKRAVLRSDGIAPVRDDALGVAEAMYDPDLVFADTATDAELESIEPSLYFDLAPGSAERMADAIIARAQLS